MAKCRIVGPYLPVGDTEWRCSTHGVDAVLNDPSLHGGDVFRREDFHCPTLEGDTVSEQPTPSTLNIVESLRAELKSKPSFERGTVIKFQSRSITATARVVTDYDYAGIFAGDNRWYLTGKNNYYGDRLTTQEFLEVLKNGDVHNIQVATEWAAL